MVHALYRDVNGTDVRGEYAGSNAGIRVKAYFNDALHDDCWIVKQKGARRYVVKDTSSGEEAVCKLVETTPSVNGDMLLVGYQASSVPPGNTQPNGGPIAINKLQKRTAIDWNDNRYTWVLENDSSMDYISLTPFN